MKLLTDTQTRLLKDNMYTMKEAELSKLVGVTKKFISTKKKEAAKKPIIRWIEAEPKQKQPFVRPRAEYSNKRLYDSL